MEGICSQGSALPDTRPPIPHLRCASWLWACCAWGHKTTSFCMDLSWVSLDRKRNTREHDWLLTSMIVWVDTLNIGKIHVIFQTVYSLLHLWVHRATALCCTWCSARPRPRLQLWWRILPLPVWEHKGQHPSSRLMIGYNNSIEVQHSIRKARHRVETKILTPFTIWLSMQSSGHWRGRGNDMHLADLDLPNQQTWMVSKIHWFTISDSISRPFCKTPGLLVVPVTFNNITIVTIEMQQSA